MCIAERSKELFNQGFSCSESIVRAAFDCKVIDTDMNAEDLNKIASAFSGGMGESGCLCGAVAGAQIVLGYLYGRKNLLESAKPIKSISKEFVESFKKKRKATCCKALTAGYDFHSSQRREHCAGVVLDVANLLEEKIK